MTEAPTPYSDGQERMLRVGAKLMSRVNRGLLWVSRGRLGQSFRGAPVCLLTTTGRRSGRARTVALIYVRDGEDVAVIASLGGSRRSPDWYHNLVADPQVVVEIDGVDSKMVARTAAGEERERLWAKAVEVYADYATYQARTDRQIPVVVCSPLSGDQPV